MAFATWGFAESSRGGQNFSRTDNDRSIDRSKLTCTHCLKIDHEVANCFKLIDFPEWWWGPSKNNPSSAQPRSRSRGSSSTSNKVPGIGSVAQRPSTMVSVAGSSTSRPVAPPTYTSQDRAAFQLVVTDAQWSSMMDMFR